MIAIEISPPNSVLLISDLVMIDIPTAFDALTVTATKGCIAVGCRSVDDGPTEVLIGPIGAYVSTGICAFSGQINTPSRVLLLSTILGEVLLEVPVANVLSHIDIWVGDEAEPERIEILVV